ncbi:hypothetical protein NW762_011381 [Fusarium torreyae]|uniref:Uncharacterized protein n=1 Tax=Fusarium torreyae TaxID=1237075 RepID=A0A9W8RPF6_9HYPO|nr:hypothetical protein NW762_011381 [Fusarium torreyae]
MAEQAHIQSAKEKFQTAFTEAVSAKESAEADYKEEKDNGLTNDNFDAWSVVNAPAYSAAKGQYDATRSQYERTLQNFDWEGFQAWREKVKQAANDNIGPHGPDYGVLVGPE